MSPSDPAREFDRPSAKDELDAILREADTLRRRGGPRNPAEPTLELHPRLDLGGTDREVRPAQRGQRGEVRFEGFDVKVDDPGELKFRTFRFSAKLGIPVALGALAAYLWIGWPSGIDWLRPQPLPSSYLDASARWAMVLTAERIDRFYAERFRLPLSLEELGPAPSELVTYERLSDSEYRLQAPGEDRALMLGPATPHDVFLGSSLDILRIGPDKAP